MADWGDFEDFMKKELIFDGRAFFRISLHTTLYGAMTATISCLRFRPLSSMLKISCG